MIKIKLSIFALIFLLVSAALVGVALCQDSEEPIVADVPVAVAVFISFLVYSLAGVCNAVVHKQSFDGKKIVYTFLISILVIAVCLMTGLEPSVVWASHGDLISETISTMMEAGVFLPLIYMLGKFVTILAEIWKRAQAIFPP